MKPDIKPDLRKSDAVWLERGQRLGEAVLTTRKYAGYGWAAGLTLAGGSLIALALVGPPQADMPTQPTITSDAAAPH